MIAEWKSSIRAWLIALAREAIKAEMHGFSIVMPSDFADAVIRKAAPVARIRAGEPQPIVSEPSFEQMQAEALKAQEKYYEPA